MSIPLKKVILPINQDEWERIGVINENFLLTTSLAIAAGAVLEYLEKNGPSKLWEMSCELTEWPTIILIMSIGALVREHLVYVRKRHRGIVLELLHSVPFVQKEMPVNNRIRKNLSFLLIILFFISSLAFAGGISQDKLKELSLGMKKDEIISVLGRPDSIQTEGMNEAGNIVERLEYSIMKPMSMPTEGSTMGPRSGEDYRPGSYMQQDHPSTYVCSLVTVNQVLVRIEKQPEKPENSSGDYQPRMHGGNETSLNL